MARQNKKGRNELDLILEQLKRSYASDSADSLEDDLLESPKREEDAELNEILGRIFSYEEKESKPEPAQQIAEPVVEVASELEEPEEQIAEIESFDIESPTEDDVEIKEISLEEAESTEENTEQAIFTEETDTTIEAEPQSVFEETVAKASISKDIALDDPIIEDTTDSTQDDMSDNSTDIDAVDNVLSIMFSGKSKNVKSEIGGKAVESIIEDTVSEATVTESTEIMSEETSDPAEVIEAEKIIEVSNAEFPAIEETLEDIEPIEYESEEIYNDSASVCENDTGDITDILEDESITADLSEDIVFAVEDEEYSTEEAVDEAEAELSHDQVAEEENEAPQYEPISLPHIILTRAEYTSDPLQDSFPTLCSNTPIVGKAQDRPAARNKATEQSDNVNKEDSSFDENDISLLLKIGYDQEIRSKVGEKKAQQVMLESDSSFTPDPTKKIFGFCGKELTDRKQISKIKEKYKTNQKNLIILLSVASVLSLLLLYITFSFEFFTDKVANFPVFLLMDFILVLILMAVAYKKLISGINKLIKLETSINTLIFFIATAYALYTIFSLIAYAIGGSSVNESGLMLFGFSVSIYVVLSFVSDLLNCIRERKTFDIIGESDTLYTAEKSDIKIRNRSAGNENNYKIRKTKLVSGYFRKISQNDNIGIKPMYLLGIVPIVSIALGLAAYFLSFNISLCISVVMLSLLLCVPVPFVFTSTLVRFILLNPQSNKKVAYIGNSAPEEMSKATCLTFSDRDAIEIVGYTEIHPSGRSDTNESLKIAYEIFSALGGPLSAIGNSELSSGIRKSHDVVINQITNDGIDIYYDSSVNVLLGDKHYMQSHNIKVKTDTNLHAATKGADKSVIFMAFDGVPKLGFIINSRVNPKFMVMSESLIKSGIRICVQSYEPQINDLYFEQNKGQFMSSVSVIKPDHYDSIEIQDMCDGCVVSASESFELAQLITQSSKISERLKINKLVNTAILASCILAAIAIALIATKGVTTFDWLSIISNHLTTVFNAILVAGLIPVIFEIVAIFQKNKH